MNKQIQKELIKKFEYITDSGKLFHHSQECCNVAQSWFMSRLILDNDVVPPRWIRDQWGWGSVEYPFYWCDLVKAKDIGCTILTALARIAFAHANISAVSVQVIEEYDESFVEHVRKMWIDVDEKWLHKQYVFHEIVGVDKKDYCRFVKPSSLDLLLDRYYLWDPTDSAWRKLFTNSKQYGRIVAYRLVDETKEWTFLT